MARLLFEKKGQAVWISHLDLMRVFQRAFKRAGLQLTHTQGFNPRPSVSIALPLSVGVESACELLDFDLDGMDIASEELQARLNDALIAGVRVLSVYPNGKKIKELTFLHCAVTLEYDNGIPKNAESLLKALFSADTLIVPKTGKNGIIEQDIVPLIHRMDILQVGDKELTLDCLISCQNPSLNPMQLVAAINMNLDCCKPDFAKCRRIEIYDAEKNVFR